MSFNSLLEAESFINNLDEENKQKLVTTISFMLINNISQQNNIDEFVLIQKMIALIPNDNQKVFLSELNGLVIKHLFKNNIDVFPIIHKLSTILTEDKKNKIINDINFIISNTVKSKVSITTTQTIDNKKENTFSNTNINFSNQSKSFPPPPPPPPPPMLTNQVTKFSVSNLNFPQNLNVTGTFNLKVNEDKENQKSILPIKESLKYIIPLQTELAKKALNDIGTPSDVYQYLKAVNGSTPLDEIYLSLYSKLDVINFISRTYAIYNSKYINFKKDINMPKDKDMKLRIGEWFVMFGYLEEEKLPKIVQLHAVAVRNNDVNNRRFASKTIINGQPVESKGPLFGNFLVDSEIINRDQLNQVLTVQNQFNEIIANIK
jgi:hypothetical protein